MKETTVIWAGIKAVGLYYFIQGAIGLVSAFALAVAANTPEGISAVVWWGNIFAVAIGAYLVLDGSVVFRIASGSIGTTGEAS